MGGDSEALDILHFLISTSWFVSDETDWSKNDLSRMSGDGEPLDPGHVALHQTPHVLFFNRVPKSGSEMLVLLLQWLQARNGFRHVRLKNTVRRYLTREEQVCVRDWRGLGTGEFEGEVVRTMKVMRHILKLVLTWQWNLCKYSVCFWTRLSKEFWAFP